MHQSSSESSIDKNKFPSVINLFAINSNRNTPAQQYDMNNRNFEMKSLLSEDNSVDINSLYTIDERNLSGFVVSEFESGGSEYNKITRKNTHYDSESESSMEHSTHDRISTTSTSTSSEDGHIHNAKSKSKSETYTYKLRNQGDHQPIFRKEIPEDVSSLKTHPNRTSSPSMCSSSTSGKFGNIFSRRVKIRGSISQDVSQFNRHSTIGTRVLMGSIPHGFRLNSQAADSGISNTSPDTLSSTEIYQRNLEDSRIVSKCNRLVGNLSRTGSNIPPQSILKHRRRHIPDIESSQSTFRSLISNLVSIIYISLLSTVVLVLSISDQKQSLWSRITLEGIHIFLYSTSIIFLTIFNLSDCKGQTRRFPLSGLTAQCNQDLEFDHCLILSNPSSFDVHEKSNIDNMDVHGQQETMRNSETMMNVTVPKMKLLSETTRDMFEGLFKISVLVLGIISMVRDCFELAAQIEAGQLNFPNAKHCTSVVTIVRSFLSLLFTFIQIYFLSLDSKSVISKINQRIIFGIVHLIATNVSSLIHIVISSKQNHGDVMTHQIHQTTQRPLISKVKSMATSVEPAINRTVCIDVDWMGQLTTISEEYLYPFSLQYSGLAIVIYIALLSSVDRFSATSSHIPGHLTVSSKSPSGNTQLRTVYCRVSCRNSNRGIFIGLFSLLLSIVSILLLNIFSKNLSLKVIGMNISYSTEMFLNIVTTFVIVGTLYQIRDVSLISYSKIHNKIESANRFLILLSLFGGVYLYNISCILSWRTDVPSAPFVIVSSLCTVINGTLQTVFIMLSLAKNYNSDPLPINKPKGEFISFILMNNIALWCLNIFTELQLYSITNVPVEVFGHGGWVLIKRVSIPLTLMFRLDSVISLAVIWRFI